MATTNRNDRTLGDIILSSGNGTPDHSASNGSLYVDEDSRFLYQNTSGLGWESFDTLTHGNMWLTGNSTTTTISDTTVWYSLRSLSWSGGSNDNVAYNVTNYLDILVDGTYQIFGTATLEEVATDGAFGLGISINGGNPEIPNYMVSSVEASDANRQCVTTLANIDVISGDTIELGVRNFEGTENVTVVHSSLSIKKIKD